MSAAEALGQLGYLDQHGVDTLRKLLSDEDSEISSGAAMVLGQFGYGDKRVIEKLLELLSNGKSISWSAAEALGKIRQEYVVGKLAEWLSDENTDVRARATYSLVQHGILDDRILTSLEEICKTNRLNHQEQVEGKPVHDWAFETLWRHAPLQIGDVPLRPNAPAIERIVRQEVQSHFEIEKGVLEIVWLKEGTDGEIRLIEINPETLSTGSIQAFSFAPSQDVPFPVRIADVTPDEWKQIQQGKISIPPGWSLQDRKIFRRSRG